MKNAAQAFMLAMLTVLCFSANAATLNEIKKEGVISFAVYEEFFPFNQNGKGIEVDLADALARALGVKLKLMPFNAQENMEDDLRNMVWKGNVVNYGPADVMMHVPVTGELMNRADRVKIFAPYYTEKLALAYDPQRVTEPIDVAIFLREPIGVTSDSISMLLLNSHNNGMLRDKMRLYKTLEEEVAALKTGKLAAVLAQRGEIEASLGRDSKLAITEAPFQASQLTNWTVGLAVTSKNGELAEALTKAIEELKANGQMEQIFERHGVKWRAP